jgi:hypothetical protein
MKYPTDPVGRTKLLDAKFPPPSDPQPFNVPHSSNEQIMDCDMHPGTPWSPPPSDASVSQEMDWDQAFDYRTWPSKLNVTTSLDVNTFHIPSQDVQSTSSHELELQNRSFMGYGLCLSDTRPYLIGIQPQFGQTHESMFPIPQGGQALPFHGFTDLPLNDIINTSSPARTNSIKRIRSLFKPKSGNASSRSSSRYATSQFTSDTKDSGYISGLTSSVSLSDGSNIHPRSLEEFNGLYRVACSALHEPRSKGQWKDIATCNHCQYSSIHNLGWSARYLKLEVFTLELDLPIYDVSAVDAAGNTALHYAAAGGAGLKHLRALINAGVDPCAANSAGELFVYCLRPLQPFTLEPNADCFDHYDLIQLLDLLRPSLDFDWRDNEGQTIMHALSLKILQPRLKEEISK